MEARGWTNGGGTFGIRVGAANRMRHFNRSWTEIEVEIDGRAYPFKITAGFWNRCPEFRDSGTVVRDWLQKHGALSWPVGHPPRFQLLPMGGIVFRLVGAPLGAKQAGRAEHELPAGAHKDARR